VVQPRPPNHTYIIQDGFDKGSALQTVRDLVGRSDVPVTVIGDSMKGLLYAADRGPVPQILSALMWWK
jgi:hypothetical protein